MSLKTSPSNQALNNGAAWTAGSAGWTRAVCVPACSPSPPLPSAEARPSFSQIPLGVLTLPYVCKLCGLGLGVTMLFLGYVATMWSFYMLMQANERTGGHKTYKDFCLACGGKKLFLGYDTVVIMTIFGSLLGYQVISMRIF